MHGHYQQRAALAAIVLAFGCGDQVTTPGGGDTSSSNPASNEAAPATELTMDSRVAHHASMGGADACEALELPTGCDANFSLVANERADGTVTGQWQDAFGGGLGIHVAVDCLNVVGNGAVIGGVVTNGPGGGVDATGRRALTAVVDNGKSANDPRDQLSFSLIGPGVQGITCHDVVPANFPLFDLTNGQVTVW